MRERGGGVYWGLFNVNWGEGGGVKRWGMEGRTEGTIRVRWETGTESEGKVWVGMLMEWRGGGGGGHHRDFFLLISEVGVL